MAPYANDVVPPTPGVVAQSPSAGGVYMHHFNGVVYFSQTPPQPQYAAVPKEVHGPQPIYTMPMQQVPVYHNEPVSAGCISPAPAPQEGEQTASSPVPFTTAQSLCLPAPVVYTSGQEMYTGTPPLQMVQVLVPVPTQYQVCPIPTPAPYFPGQEYSHSPPASVQYSPPASVQYSGSPPPCSTPYSGQSPVLPSSPAPCNSRTSTPNSGYEKRSEHSISTRLEVVWHGQFDQKFRVYPHTWSLQPISDPKMIDNNDVHKYMDSAKVRFICPNCQKCWTSMKGRVYFMYVLDPRTEKGSVYFKLFGQKCSNCPHRDFVHSMWYPDEIEKVIANIHSKVAQTYYGAPEAVVRVDRRRGHPSKPHPLMACQACEMNICREEHNFR